MKLLHAFNWYILISRDGVLYSRLFDGILEAFHLLRVQLSVAVLVELFNDEPRSLTTVLQLVHQQLFRLIPTHRLFVTDVSPNTAVKTAVTSAR